MSEQQKMDQERAAFVEWYGTPKAFEAGDKNGWSGIAWEAWKKRAGLPVGVPDAEPVLIQAVAVTRDDEEEGLRLEWLLEGGIAEMEFAGQVLFAMPEANSLCDEDGSAHVYIAPPASPTVKAEQVQCCAPTELALLREYRLSGIAFNDAQGEGYTVEQSNRAEQRMEAAEKACWDFYAGRKPGPSLPAAGSAVEEVEVVAWVTPEKDRVITALTEAAAREDGGAMLSSVRPYSVPCMTVAQHQRIVAALSAQQSARSLQAAVDQLAEIERSSAARLKRIDESLDQLSAPERVSVLCEALEDARQAMFAVLNQEPRMKAVAKRVMNAEIDRIDRALLASHAEGGKV